MNAIKVVYNYQKILQGQGLDKITSHGALQMIKLKVGFQCQMKLRCQILRISQMFSGCTVCLELNKGRPVMQ